MNKDLIKQYQTQLIRMYMLCFLHIMVAVSGLVLNCFYLHHNKYLYCSIIGLNIFALICFQPFKILNYLHKGFEYQQGYETITTTKSPV